MKNRTKEIVSNTAWFVAGIFATGAFWYFLSKEDYLWSSISAVGALLFVWLAIHILRSADSSTSRCCEQLSKFISEAQQLRTRANEVPLPVADHNEWVKKVSEYLRNSCGAEYETRFGDFSGMVFYGDTSEKSRMLRSLEGRSMRLHEFIGELCKLFVDARLTSQVTRHTKVWLGRRYAAPVLSTL